MPQSCTTAARTKGITLVEVLIVVAVLLILVSFALPSMNVGGSKTSLITATEQFEYSVRMARNTARSTETAVTLQIHTASENEGPILRFSTENTRNAALRQLANQHEQLDENILVQSDHASYVFDDRGMVQQPGTIILAARNDSTLSETLHIQ